MDLYARKITGWAVSASPDSTLKGRALMMAYESRGQPSGLRFHSDQGSHYLNHQCQLQSYDIMQSASRRGNCRDNAPAARFFQRLKTEWLCGRTFSRLSALHQTAGEYLTGYYTAIRPHRHHNGLPPDEAERIYDDNVRKSVTCFS